MNNEVCGYLNEDEPRVSYTINNEQPVICTIIGDEPLSFDRIEGHAYCDTCDAVCPYHTVEDYEPVQPPELRKYKEYICNECDDQIFLVFMPDDRT